MPELTPQQKAQLDKNIKAMLSQGASEQDVISYATDFRARFDVKKKVSIADVGMAARGGGEVGVSKAPSGETTSIVSKPGVDVEAYNTGMRQKLGVPKVNLGSDLPQIKKAREEKEYLKLRGIEENDIIPFETAVFTGTVQPTQIKELANKPYGKKVINDVLRDHAPEAGGLSFDDDVFRNEQNAEQVAQVLQQKFRQQGLEIQNQNLFNLDKEVSETLNGLKRIDIAVSAGTGGGAANVSEYNLPQLNTSSPSDLGEALEFLSKSEGSSFDVNGRKLSQKEITDLSEKINEKLYYIKAGEPIHPEILSEEVSTKLANAVSKVDAEWKGDINYSPNQKQELVQKDIQYAEEGLNFLKDANKVAYNNIMNGILKKEKIADVDYEQLIGIGKRLENEKKFRGGEFLKDDNRDFRTYQTLKADEAKILSEKIKEMGFKNKAKIADKVIIKAALESGIDPNSKRVLDIRRDEALGGYGIVKGGGLTALARGISQPFKSIQTTLNSIFDDPTFTYLNSRRYDYGDQIVPDAAGNYSDVLPSERGYKNVGNVFNKILEGAGQFATQVFTSRLGGQIISAPYRAAALSVPRAALTTTQATNIAAYGGGFLSTALQTYGQSYVDFLNKTGNPNKASLMAFIDTLGQSAIEVSILPDVKLAESMKDALGSAKRNLATDIMKIVEKGGGKEAAGPFIKKFVQEAGKVYGKEILGEEVSQNMYNYLVESIFSPKTAEKRNLTDETKEVIKDASLSMVVPIVLGGLGGAKRNRKLTQDALHISAQNFEKFTEAIENGRVKGIINPQDADAALNIIKIHQQSIENAPKEDSNGGLINAARQLEYAYQNTVEQVAKEKLSKITDEVQAEPVKKQIEEAQAVKRKIFNGAEMSGIPKDEKEEQPTIDQDRVLGDEEKDQELLTTLQELAQEGVKDQDLQFFVDQAANAPNQFIETYGEQVTQELLDKATTEQIQKGLEDARKFENNPNVSLLEKELERRGKTAEAGSVGVGGELADEDRIERRKKNENITTAPGSTYYSDVNLKNSKIGDEIHYEEYKDGKFIKHKTKVKDIVGGEVIFENGQSQKDVSSYMNITAEDAWFAKNQKQSLKETTQSKNVATKSEAGSVGVGGDGFKQAGEKARDTKDATHIGRWMLDNSQKGDVVRFQDGGYEVTEVNTKKDGTKELVLTPFEFNEDGSKDYNNSGVKIITEQSIKNGSNLFENAYTNSKGERVVEQSTYEPVEQSLKETPQSKVVATKEEVGGVGVGGDVESKKSEIEKLNNEIDSFDKEYNSLVDIVNKEDRKLNSPKSENEIKLNKLQDKLSALIDKRIKIEQSLKETPKAEAPTPKPKEQTPVSETPKTQAKELADKVRKLKIDLSKLSDGGLQSNPLGLPVAVWNGAMDIVAKTIEAGGQVADAIKRGLNYIQKNHRGQWDKKGFNDQVMKELGVRGITVNGEDFIVKNDAKTEREFAQTVNGWYSDLEQSVLDIKGDKGSGEQWKKVLGNSDEAKWTGLNEWLSQQKGQVSKKDIQNYLKDNRIEIVEVVKSNEIYDAKNPYLSWTGNDDFLFLKDSGTKTKYEIRKKKLGFYDVYDGGENIGSRPTLDEAKELAEANFNAENGNPHIDKNAATKFQGYQLEGEKTNYKEVLVTMPDANKNKNLETKLQAEYDKASEAVGEALKPLDAKTKEIYGTRFYSNLSHNEKMEVQFAFYNKGNEYKNYENAVKKMVAAKEKLQSIDKSQFKSSHFDEPNILVHLRMNTRLDAEDNKVLFLEELQSDFAQAGRKQGFKLTEQEAGKAWEEADKEYAKFMKRMESKYGKEWESEMEKSEVDEETKLLDARENTKGGTIPQAPFVTDTNAWTKLGLKVALKEAVKQGADKIAWTTGEQQNDRYDLSKSVDGLEYQPQRDGKYDVFAHKDDNNIFYEKGIDLKRIEDVFGKDIADKISKNEGTKATYDPNKFNKRLEGDGLKVGGKGMKGFYGSPTEGSLGIVGNVAKSLFKQEPKTVDITTRENVSSNDKIYEAYDRNGKLIKRGNSEAYIKSIAEQNNGTYKLVDAEQKSTQHSIDITPELKAEVEGGLPLFKDIKGRGKEIADLLRKGKIKMGGLQSNIAGIPIALYNTAIETIALALEGGATLTQAIQKAINKHKLNQQKNFNQKEFISKLEDTTGEKFTDDQQEPPKPPKEEPSPLEGDEGSRKKAVLNRLYNAKNTPEEAKRAFEREKLDYKPSSQKAAADLAKSIVDEFGVDEAVRLADSSSMFEGDVRTLIFAEVLNRLQGESNAKKWAEVAITMDKFERSAGRATAAVNYFYKNNPYGVVLKEQADRKEAFDKWATPKKEQEWKEYFELIKKEPEFEKLFQERVSEELKKERAESRKNRIVKVRGIFKKAKDSLKSNNTYATIIPPHILETVLETMELAYEGGEAVATLIQDAIDSISKKLGHSNWDSDKFRKEWEEKLKEPSNIPLTEAEQKKKILDKFRNKLSGLTNKQKDEVVRKMFEKVVDAGALEYDDLRDIIADTLGYGELTKDESKRLQELVQKRNATDEAALKAREAGEDLRNVKNLPETDFVNKKEEVKKKEKEAEQALENYYKTEIEAGKAARELQELLWNKPDVVKRITSIMQLSTLGIPALINNPIYNFFNQIGVRFPVGLVNSTIDKIASLVAKAMGKPYQREYNIFETQGEFWSKLMLGTKESAQQLFTGLNRQDYIQKEYYGQQIRPMRALKDLINYKQGKKKLNQKQIWDKALQASVGVPAEVVARVLNLGDKPMRFSAEGSQAAAFAKTLGLKGIDYKLFIEFPREEAYRAYKQKGLTEEEASTKADYVKEAIIQEGKRATFQQDNILNDIITAAASIFGGKDSGFANLTKSLVISPYIKIPTNAFWSYYNLINPEVAILQSFIHAGRAKSWSSKGNEVNAKLQMREARYWMAHAITGIATRAVVIMLVQSGVYVSGSGDDESKKERDAKSFFEQPGSINISKLKALINGEDPSKVKDGLLISNRWIGQFGTVGNAIVSKYEDATPEQREAQDDFWRIVLGGMELDALKEMENGIFANSSSLLQSISNQDFSRYGTNTLNMFANILQPATFAQMNRAALDEVPQAKGDTFLQKLNQNFAQRSTIYRNMFNVRLQYKRNMWGETMPKGGNFLSRMFGISRVDDKKDGRPMYDDFLNSTDSGFLPPVVLPVLNGEKLNTEQHDRLQMYIGNERKSIVLDFINDKLEVPILGLKYSQMPNNETKKAALQYLYQVGRENGLKLFYKDFSELEPKEKNIEEQIKDQLLQEGLELIKMENSQE